MESGGERLAETRSLRSGASSAIGHGESGARGWVNDFAPKSGVSHSTAGGGSQKGERQASACRGPRPRIRGVAQTG